MTGLADFIHPVSVVITSGDQSLMPLRVFKLAAVVAVSKLWKPTTVRNRRGFRFARSGPLAGDTHDQKRRHRRCISHGLSEPSAGGTNPPLRTGRVQG